MVVYSNRAKEELLGVPDEVLRAHGAVSAAVRGGDGAGRLSALGRGVRSRITGIAGPDGGTPTKPVGTVFIGAGRGGRGRGATLPVLGWPGAVKWQSSQMALDMLRRKLAGSGA